MFSLLPSWHGRHEIFLCLSVFPSLSSFFGLPPSSTRPPLSASLSLSLDKTLLFSRSRWLRSAAPTPTMHWDPVWEWNTGRNMASTYTYISPVLLYTVAFTYPPWLRWYKSARRETLPCSVSNLSSVVNTNTVTALVKCLHRPMSWLLNNRHAFMVCFYACMRLIHPYTVKQLRNMVFQEAHDKIENFLRNRK